MKKLSSLILFIIFHCFYIVGQPIQFGSPQITNFTSQDYNGEDQNWHIYQDKRGIIYFANSAGILEFDGIRWKLINMPNGLTSWRVIGGGDGKIIIGGSSEIGYLASDSTCNSYYKSILPQIPKKYHDFRDIWGLYYYQDKIIAITIDKILLIGENTKEIKKDATISELGMFNNKLYLSIEGEGIFYLDKNKLHNANIKNYNNCQYRRLMQIDQSKGILAGKAGGLFILENGEISPLTTELDKLFPKFVVYHILKIDELHFAIATVQNGIFILNQTGNIIRHINTENGLSSNTIYYLFLDNQKRLWAGHNKGISCIEIFSPFIHFDKNNGIEGTLKMATVFNNKLYLGGEPTLCYTNWPIKKQNLLPKFKNIDLNTGGIHKLTVIDDKLFCNHQKGISIIDKENAFYTIEIYGMCWGITPLNNDDERILINTNTTAYILEKKGDKWFKKNTLKGHGYFEKAIGFDYNKYLWTYVRNKGVVKLKLNTELDSVVSKKLYTHAGRQEFIPSLDLFIVNQQVFVFVQNNVYAYNSFEDDFIKLNFDFEGKILQILEWKEQENFWAITTNGIQYFRKSVNANYYPDDTYLKNFKYLSKTVAVYSISDSEHIFIHPNKVSYYRHEKNLSNQFQINPRICRIKLLNNDSLIFGGNFPSNSDIFNNEQSIRDVVSLNASDNSIRFLFGTATPQFSTEISYQYKLENFDKKWSKWTNETSKDYTNLSPGVYNFVLKTKSFGKESEKIARYKFKILPPWYLTMMARIIYVIILLVAISFAYWSTIHRIKNKYKKDKQDFKIDLITNISHEIKTPISLILGPLEGILAKDDDPDEKRALFVLMYRNAKRLKQLVNLLVDLRKDEEGSIQLKVKKADIVQFVEDLFIPFKHIAKLNNIDYQFITAFDTKNIYYDEQKLEAILTNLLSHAFKNTIKDGKINVVISNSLGTNKALMLDDFKQSKPNLKIGSLESKNYLEITIEDTGSDITEESMSKIFEKFYEKGTKKQSKKESLGLGMAFTEKLVTLHRCEILVWVEPGYGSKFTIRLASDDNYYKKTELADKPIQNIKTTDSQDNKSVSKTNKPDTQHPVIMLVDDEEDMRIYLKRLFLDDYDIIEANNGADAEIKIKEYLPDAVISDIKMPVMDGIELCRKIKNNESTSHIPILLLTGNNNEKTEFESFKSGANQYIEKPFNPELLKVRVRQMVENVNKQKQELHFNFNNGKLKAPYGNREDILVRAAEIINNNLLNPNFSVNSLAMELNLSRTVFYKKFKEYTPITPNDFIQIIRLEKGKSLLNRKDLTISEVADLVGFNDAKYFSTSFKKHFNQSPREYQKNRNN